MGTLLPTFIGAQWSVAALRESLLAVIERDTGKGEFVLFAYAVTGLGWDEIRKPLLAWQKRMDGRAIHAYVGTDHGLTEPSALAAMDDSGVQVRLMQRYTGTYHPKVFWLKGVTQNHFWIGSNNLTFDGLRRNIEFATLIKSPSIPGDMVNWFEEVKSASTLLTLSS